MDEKQQALLSYLLGKGLQQEERRSHVMKQHQTAYQSQARAIPVPTHEEIQAQREKAAAAKEGRSLPPPAFTPMQWSELQQAAAKPPAPPAPRPRAEAAPPAAPPPAPSPAEKPPGRKVSAPLWEKVKRQ